MSRLTRSLFAVISGLTATAMMIVGGIGLWVTQIVNDTDRFVATAERLLEREQVQREVIHQVSSAVMTSIDPEARIDGWVDDLIDRGIDPKAARILMGSADRLTERLEPAVRRLIATGVSSEPFAEAWSWAARSTHSAVLAYLRGDTETIVGSDEGALVFRLDVALGSVSLPDQLGVLLPDIPLHVTTVEIASAETVGKAQRAYQAIDWAADWLPWLGLLMLGAAVVLSRHRIRLLIIVGSVLAVTAIVVALSYHYALNTLIAALIEYGSHLPA